MIGEGGQKLEYQDPQVPASHSFSLRSHHRNLHMYSSLILGITLIDPGKTIGSKAGLVALNIEI